jgi:tetratricopeptide (TPR) repeat protein
LSLIDLLVMVAIPAILAAGPLLRNFPLRSVCFRHGTTGFPSAIPAGGKACRRESSEAAVHSLFHRGRAVLAGSTCLLAWPLAAPAHQNLDVRLATLTAEIARATNNAALYLQRGELHREHLDWPAAAADYDRAALLDAKLSAVDLCRARMLADSARLPEARAQFDRYLARCPDDGRAYVERARLLVRLKLRPAAMADFTRALLLLSEPQPDVFLERAQALLADARVDGALRSLDEGVKQLGPVVTLQVVALELELKQKQFDAALAQLDTIMAQAARKENWLARRGDIELLAGRPADARISYVAALTAVTNLPARLQQSPLVLNLRTRVQSSLQTLPDAPAEPTSNPPK